MAIILFMRGRHPGVPRTMPLTRAVAIRLGHPRRTWPRCRHVTYRGPNVYVTMDGGHLEIHISDPQDRRLTQAEITTALGPDADQQLYNKVIHYFRARRRALAGLGLEYQLI